jgi:hypothetical protein
MPVKKKLGSGVSLNGSSEKPKNSLYIGFPGPPRPDGNISGHPINIIRLLFPGILLYLLFPTMNGWPKNIKCSNPLRGIFEPWKNLKIEFYLVPSRPPNHYRKENSNRACRGILSAILIPFRKFAKQ